MMLVLPLSVLLFVLTKIDRFHQSIVELHNIRFHDKFIVSASVMKGGQTDMAKFIGACLHVFVFNVLEED